MLQTNIFYSKDKIKEDFRMKKAEEMYNYCKEYNFGHGMTEKWAIKHFSLIEKALKDDEDVLMVFIGLHNYVSATKHNSNFAYALTNKRFIMAQKKVVGENFQMVLLDRLNDVSVSTGLLMGIITIDTMKETVRIAVNKSVAENINEKLHDIIYDLKSNNIKVEYTQTKVNSNPYEELKSLKELMDMGIITNEEFEAKKKQLLGI